MGIPVVIIGGVTASSIFSNNGTQSELWTYVNGGLALVVTALAGVSNFIGTAEKTSKHQTASFKYSKISMDIDTLLSFARHERKETPQNFIQSAKAAILEIRENTPEVLPWIMADYLNKFDKSLTDTKCKINKQRSIAPDSPVFESDTHADELPNPDDTEDITRERETTNDGLLLADFADKVSTKMMTVGRRLQDIHLNSDVRS